ncbi:MAG: hypothetical protein BWY42_00564 [Candidatus Omnitrophica bacterium ADurb.Bin277]|nr:MAG: hypothetical protein BWY42_00564 [Candidatus Omnitrophica bacterium ADurb.Bin277]
MEQRSEYLKKIESILEQNPDYKFEAYTFVLAALHDTVSGLKKPRHVSGPELLEGIRSYGIRQFGPMTLTVFRYWGIKSTLDFGKIVFALIDVKLLSKQPEDKLEDFENGYDFEEAFGKYQIED